MFEEKEHENFKLKLFKCLQEGEEKVDSKGRIVFRSLYEEVFSLYDNSKEEQESLYPEMRKNGFLVRSEVEARTYVQKVAHLHRDKFSALYKRFFNENKNIFENDITLVIWGCGIGLDLFAFYDAAMQQEHPEHWVCVRNLVLLDISPWALKRAKATAEVLFPMAKIIAEDVDLTASDLGLRLEQLGLQDLSLIPRVHLISNVIDLVVQHNKLEVFWNNFTTFAQAKSRKLNDFILIFSPNYGELRIKKSEVTPCLQNCLQKNSCTIEDGPAPLDNNKTIYFSYRLLSNYWKKEGRLSYDDCFYNKDQAPFFRSLRREIIKILEDTSSTFSRSALSQLFNKARENALGKYYQAVQLMSYKFPIEDKIYSGEVLLFCPKKHVSGNYYRPFIYCDHKTIYYKYYKSLIGEIFDLPRDNGNHSLKNKKNIFLTFSDGNDSFPKDYNSYYEPQNESDIIDFESLFFLRSNGETLVNFSSLDKQQKNVAAGRRQLRKIRGSAGTGKTLTMLWHGILAYQRMHLPILFLGKTNSLLSINGRRFASVFKYANLTKRDVAFMTINNFMCKILSGKPSCKGGDCAMCNNEVVEKIKNNEIKCPQTYGAIMLDEAQISEPEIVEAIYLATKQSNPFREFYLFCDEQQTLHKGKGILERNIEEAQGKLVIKMPDKNFGRFITLKGHHRFKNNKLVQVAEDIQNELSDHYDIENLKYDSDTATLEESSFFSSFRIFRGAGAEQFQINDCLSKLMQYPSEEDSLVVMFNCQKKAETYGAKSPDNFGLLGDWKMCVTHSTKYNYWKQKEARKNFAQYNNTLHITTIDCMQGHTFSRVLLVINDVEKEDGTHIGLSLEALFTACTRAKDALYILDATRDGRYYAMLKHLNDGI